MLYSGRGRQQGAGKTTGEFCPGPHLAKWRPQIHYQKRSKYSNRTVNLMQQSVRYLYWLKLFSHSGSNSQNFQLSHS